MKKSHKKRVIYDAMALRLAVCLESFIDEKCPNTADKPYGAKIDSFSKILERGNDVFPILEEIFDRRHKIAHPRNNGSYIPYLDYDKILKFRSRCAELDSYLGEESVGASPMSRIMFHSLPYDMGNAGDLIKHGALSIVVRWWCHNYRARGVVMRIADPFGGCPWEEVENHVIQMRLRNLGNTDIGGFVSKCLWDNTFYYNSGHVAKRAVHKANMWFHKSAVDLLVLTSDKEAIARSDLAASGLHLLERRYKDKYDNSDGYSILDYAKDFDVVLLDPFDDFMPRAEEYLERIRKIAEENPKIVFIIFVLDKYTEAYQEKTKAGSEDRVKEKHDMYHLIKEGFEDFSFSLRCPAIKKAEIPKNRVGGESDYDSEVLLISRRFEGATELRHDLQEYANALSGVLPLDGKEIEFWPK